MDLRDPDLSGYFSRNGERELMPQESEHFSCPCCGMHAPLDRVLEEGPFELKMFQKILGGKTKLSDEEKELRKGLGFHRGSGPGRLAYDEIPLTDDVREAVENRIAELAQGLP